jgi:hypothetical protein
MDVHADVHLSKPERLGGFYSNSVLKSLSIFGRYPVNMNISAAETGTLQTAAKTQNGYLLENGLNDSE